MTRKSTLQKGIIALFWCISLSLNAQTPAKTESKFIAHNTNNSKHKALMLDYTEATENRPDKVMLLTEQSTDSESYNSMAETFLIFETRMQKPYIKTSSIELFEPEPEEEIKIELWMTDLSAWKQ